VQDILYLWRLRNEPPEEPEEDDELTAEGRVPLGE
jgi:hypothetical protein